jgi:hypothetical protein
MLASSGKHSQNSTLEDKDFNRGALSVSENRAMKREDSGVDGSDLMGPFQING